MHYNTVIILSLFLAMTVKPALEEEYYKPFVSENGDEEVIIIINHNNRTIDAIYKQKDFFGVHMFHTSITKNLKFQLFSEPKREMVTLNPLPNVQQREKLDSKFTNNDTVKSLKKFIEHYENQLKSENIKGES